MKYIFQLFLLNLACRNYYHLSFLLAQKKMSQSSLVSKTASSQELKSIVLAVWLKEEEEKTAMDVLEQRGSPLQCGFGYASHWV